MQCIPQWMCNTLRANHTFHRFEPVQSTFFWSEMVKLMKMFKSETEFDPSMMGSIIYDKDEHLL